MSLGIVFPNFIFFTLLFLQLIARYLNLVKLTMHDGLNLKFKFVGLLYLALKVLAILLRFVNILRVEVFLSLPFLAEISNFIVQYQIYQFALRAQNIFIEAYQLDFLLPFPPILIFYLHFFDLQPRLTDEILPDLMEVSFHFCFILRFLRVFLQLEDDLKGYHHSFFYVLMLIVMELSFLLPVIYHYFDLILRYEICWKQIKVFFIILFHSRQAFLKWGLDLKYCAILLGLVYYHIIILTIILYF